MSDSLRSTINRHILSAETVKSMLAAVLTVWTAFRSENATPAAAEVAAKAKAAVVAVDALVVALKKAGDEVKDAG